MNTIKNYIEENKERFLNELFELIRIPSISSIEAHKPDMIRCAEYWKKLILEAGADKCEIMPTQGKPVVYAEKIIDPKLDAFGPYLNLKAKFPSALIILVTFSS